MREQVLGPASLGLPFSGAALHSHELFVASRYLRPQVVIGYDLARGAVTRAVEVPRGEASWGMTVAGGAVYLGQQGARGGANLYRLDPSDGRVEPVAAIDTDTIWDLAAGPDGQVFGVAAGPFLFAYDPASDRARVVEGPGPNLDLLRSVTLVGDEVVVGGRSSDGRAVLRAVDPLSGTGRPVLPAVLTGHRLVYALAPGPGSTVVAGTEGPAGQDPAVAVIDLEDPEGAGVTVLKGEATVDTVTAGGRVYATSRRSGRMWAVEPGGAATALGAPVPYSEHRALFAVSEPARRVVAVSAAHYLGTVAASGGDEERVDLVAAGVDPRPERPQSLGAGGGRVWAGGSFGLQERALGTGDTRRSFVPGEPKDIAFAAGEAYVALYPSGQVWRSRRGAEPELLATLPPDQNRPIAVAATGRWVLVTAASDRSGGGSLTRLDRVSGEARAVVDPFTGAPDQAPAGVAVDGGVAYLGGQGLNPRIAAYDVETLEPRWEVDPPRPGSSTAIGLVVADGRLLVFTPSGWLIAVDPAGGEVLDSVELPHAGGRLATLDGRVYGVGPDVLVRIEPATLAWTVVRDGLGSTYWNHAPLAADGDALYVLRGLDVLRLEPGSD